MQNEKQQNKRNDGEMLQQAQRLNLVVIITLFILLAISFFAVIRFFVVPIFLAITLATLFYPFYHWLLKRIFMNHGSLAALVTCFILMTGLFIPVYLTGHLVTLQSIEFYNSQQQKNDNGNGNGNKNEKKSEKDDEKHIKDNVEFLPDTIRNHPLVQRLELNKINWSDQFGKLVSSSGKLATSIINRTSEGIFELIAGVFLTIFALFFFLRDGELFVQRARDLSPLRPHYEQLIMSRFVMVARATIKGTIIIGLVQGVLGSATLFFLGFNTWLLWGAVMIILSIIPMVGSYFVLVPAALYLFLNGQTFSGVMAIIAATLLNYGVDYILRPRLVGQDTKIHDLVVLLSSLGGLAVFGVMGFIIGPVIAMLFATMIDIYEEEFKTSLKASNSE